MSTPEKTLPKKTLLEEYAEVNARLSKALKVTRRQAARMEKERERLRLSISEIDQERKPSDINVNGFGPLI